MGIFGEGFFPHLKFFTNIRHTRDKIYCLNYFTVQCSSVKYFHVDVQSPELFQLAKQILYPLNNSPFPQSLATAILYFCKVWVF